MSYEYDYYDALEAEAGRRDSNRSRKLIEHPDCRDPDHPGCYLCGEGEE